MCLTRQLAFPLLTTFSFVALAGAPLGARAADSTSNDAAAKQKIFESPAWQQAMFGLNEWFSVQVIYPQSEVSELKIEIADRCNKMSANQLQNFLLDLQQKLAILESPQAMAARSYVAYNLSVASDAEAEKIRRQLPDVLKMDALQVKQALYNFQQQEAATKANEAAFEVERNQQLKMIRQENQQTADANAAAEAQMNSWPASGGYSPAPYRPPVYNPAPIIFGGWGWRW
jgi:hypothetical protein